MNQKTVLGIIMALIALTMLTTFASAAPAGPRNLDRIYDSHWPVWDALTMTAMAGNVSELIFNASTVTRTYQGYFGNITGFITLGDSQNNTLYDWSVASPKGQIYAVRDPTVPVWETVTCASQDELQSEDLRIGANETIDEDSVNRTFVVGGAPDQIARFGSTELIHPQFWVANQSILENSCPLAVMYNDSYMPSPYFKEVMLSDNTAGHVPTGLGDTTGFVIYTAIIAHSMNPFAESMGFDQRNHDFEMIVGENGHGNDTGTTATTSTYYFYVEMI